MSPIANINIALHSLNNARKEVTHATIEGNDDERQRRLLYALGDLLAVEEELELALEIIGRPEPDGSEISAMATALARSNGRAEQ